MYPHHSPGLFLISYIVDKPSIRVMHDGHAVSRSSDFIVYSVEAEFIDKVVAEFGPCESTFTCTTAISFAVEPIDEYHRLIIFIPFRQQRKCTLS
jgi:hypothetical protein